MTEREKEKERERKRKKEDERRRERGREGSRERERERGSTREVLRRWTGSSRCSGRHLLLLNYTYAWYVGDTFRWYVDEDR